MKQGEIYSKESDIFERLLKCNGNDLLFEASKDQKEEKRKMESFTKSKTFKKVKQVINTIYENKNGVLKYLVNEQREKNLIKAQFASENTENVFLEDKKNRVKQEIEQSMQELRNPEQYKKVKEIQFNLPVCDDEACLSKEQKKKYNQFKEMIQYLNKIKDLKNKDFQQNLFQEIKQLTKYFNSLSEKGGNQDSNQKFKQLYESMNIENILSLFPEDEIKLQTTNQKFRKSKEQCIEGRIQQKVKQMNKYEKLNSEKKFIEENRLKILKPDIFGTEKQSKEDLLKDAMVNQQEVQQNKSIQQKINSQKSIEVVQKQNLLRRILSSYDERYFQELDEQNKNIQLNHRQQQILKQKENSKINEDEEKEKEQFTQKMVKIRYNQMKKSQKELEDEECIQAQNQFEKRKNRISQIQTKLGLQKRNNILDVQIEKIKTRQKKQEEFIQQIQTHDQFILQREENLKQKLITSQSITRLSTQMNTNRIKNQNPQSLLKDQNYFQTNFNNQFYGKNILSDNDNLFSPKQILHTEESNNYYSHKKNKSQIQSYRIKPSAGYGLRKSHLQIQTQKSVTGESLDSRNIQTARSQQNLPYYKNPQLYEANSQINNFLHKIKNFQENFEEEKLNQDNQIFKEVSTINKQFLDFEEKLFQKSNKHDKQVQQILLKEYKIVNKQYIYQPSNTIE